MYEAGSPQLHALLIGVDLYLDGGPPCLRGCVSDVVQVERYLRTRQGVPTSRIWKLTASPGGGSEPLEDLEHRPTYENIVAAFERFCATLRAGDHLLVFFSGHGSEVETCLEAFKGPGKCDECLVPWDIGRSEARYLRDVELVYFVDRLRTRRVGVTLVFDSCHSGGAMLRRDDEEEIVARGGTGEVDPSSRPPSALHSKALADAWRHMTAVRSGSGKNDGWFGPGRGFVLLAGSRPSESAYEATFDGRRGGALTHFLLEALERARPNWTYQRLYDRLLGPIVERFQQTPLIEGEAGWILFGRGVGKVRHEAKVLRVVQDAEGQPIEVSLQAGAAQGVREGAMFVLYPAAVKSIPDREQRLADARVTQVSGVSCRAVLDRRAGARAPEVGDIAVLVDPGAFDLRRAVRFETSDRLAEQTAALFENLGGGFLRVAGDGEPGDLVVAQDRHRHCVLRWPSGGDVPYQGEPLAKSEPATPARLVERLLHLARFDNVKALANLDRLSPLYGALRVEARYMGTSYDPRMLGRPDRLRLLEEPLSIEEGHWMCLWIYNDYKAELNVAVLDLIEDWSIEQPAPSRDLSAFVPVRAEDSLPVPLRFNKSVDAPVGRDYLKVFATLGPCNFRCLEMPPMGGEPLGESERGDSVGVLAALTQAMLGNTAERGVEMASESWGWTVTDLEIEVR